MREILFRAWSEKEKCYRHNVGIYNGHAVRYGYQWYSLDNDVFDSNPEQFTGLLDKHGRKIFEGDIVVTCPSPLSISDGGDISRRLVVSSWLFTDMCLSAMCKKSSKREKFYKIVGNIHDNPELLKEQK